MVVTAHHDSAKDRPCVTNLKMTLNFATHFVDFDSVSHIFLIYKHQLCRLRENMLRLIDVSLSCRSFNVRVSTTLLCLANVPSIVPRGSMSDALLFIVFMHDLLSLKEHGRCLLTMSSTCPVLVASMIGKRI